MWCWLSLGLGVIGVLGYPGGIAGLGAAALPR